MTAGRSAFATRTGPSKETALQLSTDWLRSAPVWTLLSRLRLSLGCAPPAQAWSYNP